MMIKTNKVILISVFILMQITIALGFQPPEIIQPSIAEIRNDPLKYEGKIVRITGWIEMSCHYALGRWIENDKDGSSISVIHPDKIEHGVFVQKDNLFEKFWITRVDCALNNPCKKDIEVEVEGVVKHRATATEKGFFPPFIVIEDDEDGVMSGGLVVTRVIRIEEKYRTPPVGICAPEEPENVVPPTIPEWVKPERKELNFFEGIRDTKAE